MTLQPPQKRAIIQAILAGRHLAFIARENDTSETTVRRVQKRVQEVITSSKEPLSPQMVMSKLEEYIQS